MKIFIILTPCVLKILGERVNRQSIVGDFGKIGNPVGVRVGGGGVDVLHSDITVTR